MAIEGFHPSFVFLIGAVVAALTRGKMRSLVMVATPIISFAFLRGLPLGDSFVFEIAQWTLTFSHRDELSWLFGLLFHLAALLAVIYSLHTRNRMEQVSALVYAASAIGAVLAGDLLTLFIWWEMLALSSTFVVFAGRQRRSMAIGLRYFAFQIVSGLCLLTGILLYSNSGMSLELGRLDLTTPGTMWILLAFGIKAGFPLVHTWIVDTYPAASATGTVFLCAFTTKTAVYALARCFPGTEELIIIGAVMTCFPIFYAIIENDLRKVLSYSMINQIGFMVVGIGLGTELAINGAVAHAFNDVLFKGLLFMSMGAVLHVTGKSRGTDLGGLWKKMPWTTGLCIVGAASISAVPLFSGFVSKSMVMAAAVEQGHTWLWLILLFASAGVLEHAGIKIPYFAFFAHDRGLEGREPPRNMLLAMLLGAGLCILIGCRPDLLYSMLPYNVSFEPFTTTHVLIQIQLLLFASMAVVVLMKTGTYPPELVKENLDVDVIPRLGGRALLGWLRGTFAQVTTRLSITVLERIPAAIAGPRGPGQWQLSSNWRLVLPGLLLVMALLAFLIANLYG
ncbi:MAG TPA: Na(+)/H(+) antiporter subunit D [Planctomycetes bacterium]|nr:Na(+)/H(+) antiporter subunit D [Planctomycetota bacterium]